MSNPRPEEFRRFHELLTEHAPDDYTPWYFRCREGSKAPDTSYGSWKVEKARLSAEEAVEWMERGGNVGIAGTDEDDLVNVDIDDEDETTPDDLKPTLIARSRSRTGSHGWYFEAPGADIPNIPTEDYGEVRANWQYVVAPGSYVETDPEDVPEDELEDAGYYTVEREDPVTSIRLVELPDVFVDHHNESEQEDTDAELNFEMPGAGDDDDTDTGRKSALFDITAEDVVRKEGGDTDTDERWSALFHGSDTDANMSLSSKGLIQCWRHGVTHNGLQALSVLSGYSGSCESVGTAHKQSNAGDSCIKNEDGAHIWHAWKYAKKNGYIPKDDPVPYSAICHLCRVRDICAVTEIPSSPEDGSLPAHAYDTALKTIETNDGLEPGRDPTDEISSSSPEKPPKPEPKPEPNPEGGDESSDSEDGDGGEESGESNRWEYVCELYDLDDYQNEARQAAADALEDETSFMHVVESDVLWVYKNDRGYYEPGGADYIQETIERRLGAHYSISEKSEITDRIKARNKTHRENLNAKSESDKLLCVGNGVVNFETGELLEHDPEYNFTRGIEYDYREDGGDPEPIIEFLSGITKREADWRTLIDHLAHGLMPGHPYRAFVITYGPGGNGKTQLGELFRGFVGEDNAAAVELQDLTGDDEFATGALPSAFINVGDDVSVAEIRNTSTLKTATGGGTLRANEKYEKKFDFKNEAAMFFSANEPPRIAEDKQSIGDRLYPIEMPYRHVDDPDPDNEYERKKVPGISDKLLNNEAAMEGLLSLAVEHGKRLEDTDGSYSMPEGPKGRREIYEAAADPIRRFALEFLQEGEAGDVILKDDAYTVYTNLCDRDDERPAREDTFKSQISQQSIVDVEAGQTRQLSTGDGRDPCWKYVQFDEGSKKLMPPRLVQRYFPGADSEDADEAVEDAAESEPKDIQQERAAFGAEPIRDAARSLTGYVTVTVEVATTHRLGETDSGIKAVVKDASGAIDIVSWDDEIIEQLEAADGECIALQNAEVDEYDGTHQLTTVPGLTTVETIQQGVGYTESAPEPNSSSEDNTETVQGGLEEMSTTTDGGYAQLEPDVLEFLRTKGSASVASIAGVLGEDPNDVLRTVDSLSTAGRVIVDGDGPSADVELNN